MPTPTSPDSAKTTATPVPPRDLLAWRDEFPILSTSTYMISNSLGAMPRAVYAKLNEYADTWATRGVRAWENPWWDMAVTVGDKVASLIGAKPREISLHQNVTITEAIIASCFDFSGPRNKVIMSDLEFPSIIYFYEAQRSRGAKTHLIKSKDGIHLPLEEFLKAIDETTLLVPISLVLFRSASIVDAKAIIERAHQVGAHVILDCFQATGTVPVDVSTLQPDFAVGGVLKWLCGGPGVAYLYVRPDLRKKLNPTLTGWSAHQHPFDFEVGANKLRDDAYRFLNGTPHIPALYACQPGLDIIREVGLERIREKSKLQTQRLFDQAKSRGWRVNSPESPLNRGGTISVDCPHPQQVKAELLARNILVDYRPNAGVRISPHFYNLDDEIDFTLAQIAEILETRAWERHLQPA
jgi:kynureninase